MLDKLFAWWRDRRQPAPIPDALWQRTIAELPFLAVLDADEEQRLRQLCTDFLAEKEFSAAGGLVLSDAICVSIAAQGCLPILGIGLNAYRGWLGIVVYPDQFLIPRQIEDEYGVVHEYKEIAAGEAWHGGPLLISWRDVQQAGSGYNVVIHEFAHKLDMLNGEADGTPPLPETLSRADWQTVLQESYDDFCAWVDEAASHDEEPFFDPYAAENPGEFFAVMSEAFFETPQELLAEYPALYAHFSAFYRQDPARRGLRPPAE